MPLDRTSSSKRCAPSLALLAASVLVASCGVSDRKVTEGTGGNSSSAGAGGSGANAHGGTSGSGDATDPAGSGGEAGGAGEAGEAGAANPGCLSDSLRCDNSSTPSKCIDGSWIAQDPCPVAKPACQNGVCAAATLSGGIVTVSQGVLSTSSVRLVEHGLEYTPTSCGTVGTRTVCVTGGLRP